MSDFSIDFTLSYNEDSRLVTLELKAEFDLPLLSREALEKSISNSDYSDFYIDIDKLDQVVLTSKDLTDKGNKLYKELVSKQKQLASLNSNAEDSAENDDTNDLEISANQILNKLGEAKLCFDIAEKRDAVISIGVDNEALEAFISITPPLGGERASQTSLDNALNEKGICFGIDEKAKEAALKEASCTDLLIASGEKPKKGKASRFKPLVCEQITTGPKIDEQGRADYHDINEFVIIEPGTPLMQRTTPGKGKPGTDVFGKPIPPIPGDILPFATDLVGAQPSDNSCDVLIATVKGHPVIEDRGVSVSNVLMLKNIGLSTGNVDFDGSVCVEGDVADGVNIEVSGDLTVKGVVGKAFIKAGGNVVILQGLLGGSKDPQNDDEDPYGAHIEAKGSVSAHFMTRAKISAGKHIVVPEYASHCDLFAEQQILVGQSSGKGNLFGGRARAFDKVAAKVIGSTGGTPTEIQVGAEGENIVELRRIGKEKRLNDQNSYDINEALHKISLLSKSAGMTPQMKEKAEKLSAKLETLQNELTDLKDREKVIQTLLMKSKKSRVVANQKVFNNTSVAILGSQLTIKEESKGGSFRFEARRVVFEP